MRRREASVSERRRARITKNKLTITELKKYTTNSQNSGPAKKCGAGSGSGVVTIQSVKATIAKNIVAITYRKRTPQRRRPRDSKPVMARIASETCTYAAGVYAMPNH